MIFFEESEDFTLEWSRRHAALKKFLPSEPMHAQISYDALRWSVGDLAGQPQAGSAAKSTPAAGAAVDLQGGSDPAPIDELVAALDQTVALHFEGMKAAIESYPFGPMWPHMPKHDE